MSTILERNLERIREAEKGKPASAYACSYMGHFIGPERDAEGRALCVCCLRMVTPKESA